RRTPKGPPPNTTTSRHHDALRQVGVAHVLGVGRLVAGLGAQPDGPRRDGVAAAGQLEPHVAVAGRDLVGADLDGRPGVVARRGAGGDLREVAVGDVVDAGVEVAVDAALEPAVEGAGRPEAAG